MNRYSIAPRGPAKCHRVSFQFISLCYFSDSGIPLKTSTRDASTNTIISATNTNFDDIHLKSIKTNKMYTKPRSIHDGNNCYEESLVPFKLNDEAFYLPPRSKTLVKVCINKVFRPSNHLSVLSDTIPLQLILQCFTINSIF